MRQKCKITGAILIIAFYLTGCTLPDDVQVIKEFIPDPELVHFDIYIQLLPDSTLNLDEQSHQMETVIYYLSRGGYGIKLYKFIQESQTETVFRHGVTDEDGNFKALNLPSGTYRIVMEELQGHIQEKVIIPIKGELTTLTFMVNIPGSG